jgi:hypothetical protein
MTRYELLERIGVGGMAEIFRGRAVAGGGFEKPVAIKRILPHLSKDDRFVKLLITEANTVSQLRHRNIVQIFDVGLGSDGQYFLVMEYVRGADLGALFAALEKRGKRLPAHLALHIAAEVCDALDFAHRAVDASGTPLQIVHRDVSPSNILLSKMGEVKLTDFGIAKRMEEVTGHGSVRGKFAYISPEQSRNISVDARSDVFSLGIVLFELVTGRRLFSALPDFDALETVREARVPRPASVDPSMATELEQLLLGALAAEPDRRYPSAAAMGSALREFRYSVLSAAGDPAKELARILDAVVRRDDGEFAPEPTVVRIETAAGFTGVGLEERASPGAGREGPPMFEDQETRAMPGDELLGLVGASASRAATTHRDTAPIVTPAGRVGTMPDRPNDDALATLLDDSGASSDPLRADTPTVRDVWQAGALRLDPRQVETEAVERLGRSRHRPWWAWLAVIVALALGVAAFAGASRLLDDSSGDGGEGRTGSRVGESDDQLRAGEDEADEDHGDAGNGPDDREPKKKRKRRKR